MSVLSKYYIILHIVKGKEFCTMARKRTAKPSKNRLAYRKEKIFAMTNKSWNIAKLNQTFVIGSLSNLFRASNARTMDDWENWYYQSGEERKQKLRALPAHKRAILENFNLPYEKGYALIHTLSEEELKINTHYGRTKEDLRQIASTFKKHLHKDIRFKHLKFDTIYDFVLLRVLDETFIGFMREYNTIKQLRKDFPQFTFHEVSSELDAKYAIDCEAYIGEELQFAIQIKSSKYYDADKGFLTAVKKMNHNKNKMYTDEFGVPVYYVFSNEQGRIHNSDICDEIKHLHSA